MDIKKLITRFRQFGGMRLVWEYAKLWEVPTVLKGLWWFTVKGSWFKIGVFQCFKGLYGEVVREVEPFLMERYAPIINGMRYAQNSQENLNQNLSKTSKANTNNINDNLKSNDNKRTVWWCWLQGLDHAPEIVRACYNSLKQLTGYSLVVIDNTNWREYVELPGYIEVVS